MRRGRSARACRAGVVDLRGVHLWGAAAWWFWLVAHVFFLIGFRNRLAVLGNWAWSYGSYQRHARIILGEGVDTPADKERDRTDG
jgi:NADH:ubiquinone reductase (H+-translocating)